MSHQDIIRAWKDAEYRESLSKEQRSQLPENPAGTIGMTDGDMESIAGGGGSQIGCGPTFDNSSFCGCPTKALCLTVGDLCDPLAG